MYPRHFKQGAPATKTPGRSEEKVNTAAKASAASKPEIDLEKIITKIEQIIVYADQYAKDQDLVLVIGNTGAGKSTFVNYLAGRTMREIRVPGSLVPVVDTVNPIMAVGHDLKSFTEHPQLYTDADTELTYCDCPGFLDNRGPEFDIPNAFAIKTIVEKARSIKAVVVLINYHSLIADKGRGLRESILILKQLFGIQESEILNYQDSIAILITKAQENSRITLDKLKNFISGFDTILDALKEQISFYDPLDRPNILERGACPRSEMLQALHESPGLDEDQQLFGFALGSDSVDKLSQFINFLEVQIRTEFEQSHFDKANRLLQSLDKIQILNYNFVGDAYIRLCGMVRDLIRSFEGKDDSVTTLKNIHEQMPLFRNEISESINVIALRIQQREADEQKIKLARELERAAKKDKDNAVKKLDGIDKEIKELEEKINAAKQKAEEAEQRRVNAQREIKKVNAAKQSGGGCCHKKKGKHKCTIQ